MIKIIKTAAYMRDIAQTVKDSERQKIMEDNLFIKIMEEIEERSKQGYLHMEINDLMEYISQYKVRLILEELGFKCDKRKFDGKVSTYRIDWCK